MIHVDGAMGEGGGQVLRTALTLSLVTGQPFRIHRIRAGRAKSGLAAQHLKAVEAAATVGGARVEGAERGSTTLTFEPNRVRAGHYRLDIGTAGATALVLQTIAYPLGFAKAQSQVMITGGTHVPWSPCFHYLDLHWAPFLKRVGFDLSLQMERAGFYPRGGGKIAASIGPAATPLRPLALEARGPLMGIRGVSGVAKLDLSVASRQRRRALERLEHLGVAADIDSVRVSAVSPGTFLILVAEFERSRCCVSALGARGKPAERVADEAVEQMEQIMASGAAVDAHLADQLLLPLALAEGASELTTAQVTEHLTTNAEVVRLFLPEARVDIEGELGRPGRVRVAGVGG